MPSSMDDIVNITSRAGPRILEGGFQGPQKVRSIGIFKLTGLKKQKQKNSGGGGVNLLPPGSTTDLVVNEKSLVKKGMACH